MIYLPKLYKLASTGKVYEWEIGHGKNVDGSVYTIRHGQVNGKIQVTSTLVKDGKNICKINETTPAQQAELEAISLWNKQKDRKGYTLTVPSEKPFRPMLAQKFSEHSRKIEYPAYVQSKLDGCVNYDTVVETREFGSTKIGYIVDNKLDCSVLSANKTGKKEFKKIKHHFLNKESDSTQWYLITLSNGKTIEITGNHPVYLPNIGVYRRVDELSDNDVVEFSESPSSLG